MGQTRGPRPSRGARSLFLPTGLACPDSQLAYPGRPFPSQWCHQLLWKCWRPCPQGPFISLRQQITRAFDNAILLPSIYARPPWPLPSWLATSLFRVPLPGSAQAVWTSRHHLDSGSWPSSCSGLHCSHRVTLGWRTWSLWVKCSQLYKGTGNMIFVSRVALRTQ